MSSSSSSVSISTFDEDIELVTKHLLSDEKRRSITTMVGIEGTGKTTLAKLIIDNRAIKDSFTCRVWVTVNPNYKLEQLLEETAKAASTQLRRRGKRDPKRWTLQESIFVLRTLMGIKYLIVIDGLRTRHFLELLTRTILDLSTGSRILLTSREPKIIDPRDFFYPLRLLDDERSWILFTRKLTVDIRSKPNRTNVAKNIVAKCGGLPSEILKMSDLLSRKEEWSSVLELEQPYEGRHPWSALLEFHTNLREMLCYFELFPAALEIPVRRLLALWVAGGLVRHELQQEPEAVAESYLAQLINANMVQVAKKKPNWKAKTCRLLNDFREYLKSAEGRVLNGFPMSQVADRLDQNDISNNNDINKFIFNLQSFDEVGDYLNQCQKRSCLARLWVLDLEGIYTPNLPQNIATLDQLRYLGLRRTYLESLPSSLCTLPKLQTLDLKYTNIPTLTSSIWNMQLRHLFLSDTCRTTFPPKPCIDNSLSDLQTLSGLSVDQDTPVTGGLDKLVNIRKLGITFQSKSALQGRMESQLHAVDDWIVKLTHLESLKLKSRDKKGRPRNLHLESLQDHKDLTDLYLLGRLTRPSILSQLPPSLVVLTLSHSKLEDNPMQILNDLPNLRSLSLREESYVGKKMVCNSQSFPRLHVLKVMNLKELEEWNIEEEALPSLRKLKMRSCPSMKMLPDGLKHVNSLLELKLVNMPMEISTDEHNIPPNCEVRRDNSQ